MSDVETAWRRVGRIAGYVAGAGFLVATALYLLDALDALGSSPDYHRTEAGVLHDEATFWVAYFAHQHHIMWDIVARDTIFPLAFAALVVLALSVQNIVRRGRPEAQLATLFFLVGGLLAALSDLLYLGATEYWRYTDWTAEPPERMVAIGRSVASIEALNHWPEAAGFVVLAAALICLGRLCRIEEPLPSRLAPIAYLEAILLVGIALAEVLHHGDAYDYLSLVTGAVVGPILAFWLGWHLGTQLHRPAAVSAPTA